MTIRQETIRSRRNLRSTDKVDEDEKYSKLNDNGSNEDGDHDEEQGAANNKDNTENSDRPSTPPADVDMIDKQELDVDSTSSHSMIVDSYNDEDNTPPATTALFQVDSPVYPEDVIDELESSILSIKQVVMSSLESNFDRYLF
jgi:hypothetical protein